MSRPVCSPPPAPQALSQQWAEYQAIYGELAVVRKTLEDQAERRRKAYAKRARTVQDEVSQQAQSYFNYFP